MSTTRRVITVDDDVTTFTVSCANDKKAKALREYCAANGIEMVVYRSEYNADKAAAQRERAKLEREYAKAAMRGDRARADEILAQLQA